MHLIVRTSTLRGEIVIPGSKSHTIRALVIATLAKGVSKIYHPLISADTLSCLKGCKAFGAYYEDQGGIGCDIPLDGTVSAVAISLTAIGSFGTGYMRLWPSNFSEPTATIMNYPDHQGNFNMSTNAIVPIGPKGGSDAEGSSGELWLKNYGATPDVVIDVTGYFVVADGGGTSPQDCVVVNNGEPTLWTAKLTTIGNAVYPTLEVRMQQTGCDLSGQNRDNNYEVDVSTNGTVDGAGDVSLTSVVTNGSSPRATITFTGTVSGPASTQTISGTYTATGPSVPTPSGTESGTFTMTHN